MSGSKLAKGWLVVIAALVVTCIVLTAFSAQARRSMQAANYDRQEVESIIYEFIRTNAGLKRFARVHVVTGNPLQYNLYRNYEALFSANIDRMIALGLTQEETYSFMAFVAYTEALIRLEHEAFALRAAGHHQEAIDMLFGREYEAIGIRSREALASFGDLVIIRTRESLFQAEARMAMFRTLTIMTGSILAALALAGAAVFLLQKSSGRVIVCVTAALSCVVVVLMIFLQAEENNTFYANRRSIGFEATVHEFRRVTLDTVRLSRDYIFTGERAAYYAYIAALAQVDYLTEHFRGYALSDDAMVLLYSIAEKTVGLVAIEMAALAIKPIDINEAIAIIHAPEYAALGLPRANMIILFATMVRFLIRGELDGYLTQIVFLERLVFTATMGILILLAVSMFYKRQR